MMDLTQYEQVYNNNYVHNSIIFMPGKYRLSRFFNTDDPLLKMHMCIIYIVSTYMQLNKYLVMWTLLSLADGDVKHITRSRCISQVLV